MAITKIHAIKATLPKAIKYITNPHKTDDKILVSTFACGVETAPYDFNFALSKTKQSDPNKAFHLIQSFAPGEVSYDEAHWIGIELADKLLEGKYSYVISTHIDKGHIHNHIIFCAADNIEHKKYNDCKCTYYHIRELSDTLCKEHNLSVINPSQNKGKTYKEWQSEKNGTSLKVTLRKDIDDAINSCSSYEDFIVLMKAKGYEIKGEDLSDSNLKYISFRPLDRDRFIRGSVRSLGADYTRERISQRIEEKSKQQARKKVSFAKKKLTTDYSRKELIDTSQEKFKQSPGLNHWATIQNLKIAASSYAGADSIEDLEDKISSKSTLAKTARQSLIDTEHQLKELGEILKYARDYQTNKVYNFRYKKSKDPDAYFRRHETELTLFDGAENMLKRFGINTKNLDLEQLQADYNALQAKKTELQKTYKSAEKEVADLNRKLANIKQYLYQEQTPERSESKKPEQSL